MEIAVTRDIDDEDGKPVFVLRYDTSFSAEDYWIIERHRLHDYVILNRTPPWYASERQKCERAETAAKSAGKCYDWPEGIPRTAPPEWELNVEAALHNPIYIVTFNRAADLERLEPRLTANFEEFAQFMGRYGSRPRTIRRRW